MSAQRSNHFNARLNTRGTSIMRTIGSHFQNSGQNTSAGWNGLSQARSSFSSANHCMLFGPAHRGQLSLRNDVPRKCYCFSAQEKNAPPILLGVIYGAAAVMVKTAV